MARKKGNCLPINKDFINSAILNADTFSDYLYRIQKICLSMFEWVNLPSSMDERWLEKCLFFQGSACLLKLKNMVLLIHNALVVVLLIFMEYLHHLIAIVMNLTKLDVSILG